MKDNLVKRSPVFYGWVVLAAGTLGIIMSSPGQTYSFSIFIEEFIRDLGLSRSLVSGIYAVGTVVGSFALPFIGKMIDVRGNRVMVVVITVLFGVVILYMSQVRNALMLVFGVVFMRMLGQSSMVIVSMNVINQWWVRRRGFVLGISTLVSATMGVGLFPNLIQFLIPRVGWRGAYVILAAIVVGVMVPVGWVFYREKPELYGEFPDGEDPLIQQADKPMVLKEESWTRYEAVRTRAFWLLAIGIAAFSMLGTGLTFHIVSIFGDNGLSAEIAAAIFLPMSLTTSLIAIPGGWLVDRVGVKYVLAVGLIFLTLTILLSTSISSTAFAIVYAIIFGAGSGIARVVSGVAYANYFGREHLGSITGFTSTIGAMASGLGPVVYGVGRDLAGNYWPSLLVSAIYPAVMVALVLTMKKPTK